MKLLLLTPMYPPDKGGAARAFYLLRQVLEKNPRISQILMVSSWRKGKKTYSKRGKTGVSRTLNYKIQNPLFRFTWNTLVIRHFLESFKPDVVIFHSAVLPYRQYYPLLFGNPAGRRIYLYKSDMLPIRDFPALTGVVYMAKNLRKPLIRQWHIPQEKLIYIPILFKPPPPKKNPGTPPPLPGRYILFVGAVNPLKGIYELVRAFELLKPSAPELKLVVIGPGPDGVSYHPDILFIKEASLPDVRAYIRGASAIVLPSYSEGLPRVALETLYLEKPLLISNQVEETRCLPPANIISHIEPGEIAEKIKGLLQEAGKNSPLPKDIPDFKQSARAWNDLVVGPGDPANPVEPPNFEPLCQLGLKDRRALRILFVDALRYYDSLLDTHDPEAVPTPIKETFPRLDSIFHIQVLKGINAGNWRLYLEQTAQSPDFGPLEKKILIKEILGLLENRFQVFLDKEHLWALFSPLIPLTADDMLYLGKYCLRQRKLAESKSFFLEGLKRLPESTHLEIFRLLADTPGLVTDPGERGKLEKQRETLMRRACAFLHRNAPVSGVQSYRLASLYKQLGEYEKAVPAFEEVLAEQRQAGLKAGACFHLGEIAYKREQWKQASHYFRQCSQLNPSHRKCTEYMKHENISRYSSEE